MFEKARDMLDCREVAKYYGAVFRRNRAKCPIHSGNGWNFEAKKRGFTCYSQCGSGDVIKFVQLLFGYGKPLDALKQLNRDFRLGLSLDGRSKREFVPSALKLPDEREAGEILAEWIIRLYKWKERYAPTGSEILDNEHTGAYYRFACDNLEIVLYRYETLCTESDPEAIQLAHRLNQFRRTINEERLNAYL
ncbi:MAG: hypothetical protein LBN43_03260 [Oscillospiraceae bacterium]|jgi:hypothetical protein|nr:hypothetical protein [Oscillospiraceae bacterium]